MTTGLLTRRTSKTKLFTKKGNKQHKIILIIIKKNRAFAYAPLF